MEDQVFRIFFDLINAGSRQHIDKFQPVVSRFILETEKIYLNEIDIFCSSYKSNPDLEKVLRPLHGKVREYLVWLRWLNWNIAHLAPVLFEDRNPAAERLALATMAYASGRFIDDGFDNHQNFKGHQNTLVGFLRQHSPDKPPHEACVQSVFVGFHIFHHVLRRMEDCKLDEIARELSKLFGIASMGLLAESHTGPVIEPNLYFQIIRRKAVAYNMMLYKPFLHETSPGIRNTLLLLLGEMDELAQILNDLADFEEDKNYGRLNVFTHLNNSPTIVREEILVRMQKLASLINLLPIQVQNAFAAMLVNLKLEDSLKKLKSLLPTPLSSKTSGKEANPDHSLTTRIQGSIGKALEYITKSQGANGEFPTYWSEDPGMTSAHVISSPFITGMILHALAEVDEKSVPAIWGKGLAYLKRCRKADGFFSFLNEGMDDDLDDTCLLNFLIQQKGENAIYYTQLAERISKLPRRKGLYFTWIRTNAENHNDIDPCVNLNIVRFLSYNGIECTPTLKALKSLSQKTAVSEGTIYYQSDWAFLYFFSTLPKDIKRLLISNSRLSELLSNPAAPNPVDQAMRLYCLATAGIRSADTMQLATLLLESQAPTGEWPNFAVFRAFNYWGSAELTTALCIQAIWKFEELRTGQRRPERN